jgi:hypothetical protein
MPTSVSVIQAEPLETFIGKQESAGEMLAMANFNLNSDYGCELFQSC